jgi:membrane-bound serine protease (ClpP class)
MKFLSAVLVLIVLVCASTTQAEQATAPPPGAIWVLELDDAVGPATSDYLVRGIEDAATARAQLVVILMNTPGGLDGAMRDIIAAILASPVPVATFVSPQGSRAASAGTYILYASHVAAMAPATHLGAATPVSIGFTPPSTEPDAETTADEGGSQETAMERKMVNDASAYIRGLADLRGRNSEWAELAVREAASLSAQEALDQNVIDLIAKDLNDLITQLDGRELVVNDSTVTLQTSQSPIHQATPDWRTDFLATITNPSLVLILGMIGFYGIILEFYNPGSLVPGTIGVICLILAGYGLQLLPVNYAGLALILVGMGLMAAEAFAPSFGILGVGGLTAFTIGGIILFDSDVEAFRVGWPLLFAVALATGAFLIITITLAMRMRAKSVATGIELILGKAGTALANFDGEGQVQVGAEIWQARCQQPLQQGDHVIVKDVSGLWLSVDKENS